MDKKKYDVLTESPFPCSGKMKMDGLKEKLESLSMKPEDWSELERVVTPGMYHVLVNEYQDREEGSFSLCMSVWKMCQYVTKYGRCSFKGECPCKKVESTCLHVL